MLSYRDLLSHTVRGRRQTEILERKRWSPSLFLVHFGIKGTWPGLPHHMMLFGPRYKGLLKDIYQHGVLARDFSLYLHHPTVTDPSLAPEGHSTFYALAPVPPLGTLPIDWGPARDQNTGAKALCAQPFPCPFRYQRHLARPSAPHDAFRAAL